MELKQYAAILRRRWWIVLGVLAVATIAGVAGLVLVPPSTTYQATVRVVSFQPPESRGGDYYMYDGYYAVLAAEYLNDDLVEFIRTSTFARLVQERLQTQGVVAPAGSFDAKKAHRVVTITSSSSTPEGAVALARAAGEILTDGTHTATINVLTPAGTQIQPLEPAVLSAASSRRALADLALRVLLGLIAGVALAFLRDYLDDTVRSTAEVEDLLGTPVIGTVPRFGRKGGRRLPPRSTPQEAPATVTTG